MKAFDSFSITYKVLVTAGYFKLMNKPKSKFKSICHLVYRWMAFILIVFYTIQHFLFLLQRLENLDAIFDGLIIMVPQINLIVKIMTINIQIPRIDKVNELINDPLFGAKNKEDEKLLLKHNTSMHLLSKAIIGTITVAGTLWPTSLFMLRYQDENAVVPSYVPFHTKTWGRFTLSVVLEILPLFWIGYGHLFLDCIVAIYYGQAEVQLKIIKYNLEHLFDIDEASSPVSQYKDTVNSNLKKRFVYYVQRYDKVVWYKEQIDRIFNPSMSFQFFTSTVSLCMVAYRLTFISGTFPIIYHICLLLTLSFQIFLYCYFGNLVKYESESIVCSMYMSDWLSVSPQFRRLLLIAMTRWSRPITPRVSGIIPLSQSTFVAILRATYSLYTVLGRSNPDAN